MYKSFPFYSSHSLSAELEVGAPRDEIGAVEQDPAAAGGIQHEVAVIAAKVWCYHAAVGVVFQPLAGILAAMAMASPAERTAVSGLPAGRPRQTVLLGPGRASLQTASLATWRV